MSLHLLQGRSESEVLWFQRRSFLQAAAAWVASGSAAALAQSASTGRGNVVELFGDAWVNGQRLLSGQSIMTGDTVRTGPGTSLVFVIGNSAFQVRQNSQLTVERGATLNVVSILRLLTGAVISVWGPGTRRQVVTPTLTAGIRGTGVYAEVFDKHHLRTYFCNCYGSVEMAAAQDKLLSVSDYHQAYWANQQEDGNGGLAPARQINHTDTELEFLAKLVQQQTAWQISGKKGHARPSARPSPAEPAAPNTTPNAAPPAPAAS
jgi:hypothetical protein